MADPLLAEACVACELDAEEVCAAPPPPPPPWVELASADALELESPARELEPVSSAAALELAAVVAADVPAARAASGTVMADAPTTPVERSEIPIPPAADLNKREKSATGDLG